MEIDILAELKKINAQLGQIAQLLKTGRPALPEMIPDQGQNIAAEVERRIQEAKRRVGANISKSQPEIGLE